MMALVCVGAFILGAGILGIVILIGDYVICEGLNSMEEAYEKEKLYRQEQQRLRELQLRRIEDNIRLFLETPGLYAYDPMGKISSAQLYEIYSNWCLQEEIPIQPLRAFCLCVKKHASHYRLVYAGHIPDGNGKRVRGFRGIRQLLQEEMTQP